MSSALRPFFILALLVAGLVGPHLYLARTFERISPLIALRNRFYTPPPELAPLLRRIRQLQFLHEEEALALPVVHEQPAALTTASAAFPKPAYSIRLAAQTLGLRKSQVVLANPFGPIPFPLSFSVLYQGHLVTLFAPGYFACYRTNGLQRNQALEQQLNTRRFAYHWLIDNQLIGLCDNRYFVFSKAGRWEPYRQPVPFGRQPKLFEDTRYLAGATCHGEWGGEVYFYDKQQHTYYLVEATCANSITKQNGRYFILSSLAHMIGFASLQQIDDPTQLTRWRGKTKPQDREFNYNPEGQVRQGKPVFAYDFILLPAGFVLDKQPVYMARWRGSTFLATRQNDVLTIVDPLFNDDLYAHQPVATTYGPNLVLLNLDTQDGGRETCCLLLTGRQLVKINWHPTIASVPTPLLTDTVATELAPGEIVDSVEAATLLP